jgi:hypothetical protein
MRLCEVELNCEIYYDFWILDLNVLNGNLKRLEGWVDIFLVLFDFEFKGFFIKRFLVRKRESCFY